MQTSVPSQMVWLWRYWWRNLMDSCIWTWACDGVHGGLSPCEPRQTRPFSFSSHLVLFFLIHDISCIHDIFIVYKFPSIYSTPSALPPTPQLPLTLQPLTPPPLVLPGLLSGSILFPFIFPLLFYHFSYFPHCSSTISLCLSSPGDCACFLIPFIPIKLTLSQ